MRLNLLLSALFGDKPTGKLVRMDWSEVPTAKLSLPPYRQVCEIVPFINNIRQGWGTGWLVADNTVATAAHVLHLADYCDVRWAFSNEVVRVNAAQFKLHKKYAYGLHGTEWDRAILSMKTSSQPLPIHTGPVPTGIRLLGFQKGLLVESTGKTLLIPPYLGHEAASDQGHSGAPVFANGSVVGMQIANGGRAKALLSPPALSKKFISSQASLYLNSKTFFQL